MTKMAAGSTIVAELPLHFLRLRCHNGPRLRLQKQSWVLTTVNKLKYYKTSE